MAMQTLQRKAVYTTGEVARICHVAPRTVSKWVDSGQLRGYRIPGSRDRRIPAEHLLAFLRAHGIPTDAMDSGPCRLLLMDTAATLEVVEALGDSDHCEVRTAGNLFEAGVLAQQFRPHVIVLDVGDGQDAADICRNVKENAALSSARLVAVSAELSVAKAQALLRQGFDAFLAKPYTPAQLTAAAGVMET
ncbi:MAG: helix-turn-helix domain-containing protein [Phycisphaerae bacterium]|nr:helix-turn-helix domain-containing protein [Phycisphaerae bacterium]